MTASTRWPLQRPWSPLDETPYAPPIVQLTEFRALLTDYLQDESDVTVDDENGDPLEADVANVCPYTVQATVYLPAGYSGPSSFTASGQSNVSPAYAIADATKNAYALMYAYLTS